MPKDRKSSDYEEEAPIQKVARKSFIPDPPEETPISGESAGPKTVDITVKSLIDGRGTLGRALTQLDAGPGDIIRISKVN
jgi:hypothetical protein